jgi:hypothetical protein
MFPGNTTTKKTVTVGSSPSSVVALTSRRYCGSPIRQKQAARSLSGQYIIEAPLALRAGLGIAVTKSSGMII